MTPKRSGGDALSDRYELAEQLGRGGMAEVYLGRDRVLGRTVAVKTLLAQYASDPHFIERFRREAQNAASLNHPNVVGVYDTGSDNGTHYIVMEYIEGRTLRDVIREEGPLLPERVAEIGAEVCQGLTFAHQNGIVHRDIKPANIMITASGAVKVADFGIARAVSGETVTQTAMVLGTAQYFSPEQAQAQPVDARSDLYSLGVVLYEMLTRQVPFTGSSPVAIAYKHVKEPPLLPSRLNPDVPASLEAVVLKALAKNPANRYQSAEEMREDLLRALHGRPVEAPPVLADATGIVDMSADETVMVERAPVSRIRRAATPEQKRRRTGMIILGFIIAAIVATAVWAVVGLLGGASTTKVPDVLGRRLAEASQRLESAGIDARIGDGVYSSKYPEGTVAETDPKPGTEIDKNKQSVTLFPSLGTQLVKVPDVTGKSQSVAEAQLKRADFKIGTVTYETSGSVARGRVISQNPSGGAFAEKGSKIGLVVSNGPEAIQIPNVVGLPQDEAEQKLRNFGFKPQVIYEPQNEATCNEAVGIVCRQSPDAGENRAKGSTVTIYVATEPTEESPSPEPSITISTSPSP